MIKALLKAYRGTREAKDWSEALAIRESKRIPNSPIHSANSGLGRSNLPVGRQVTQSMQNDSMQNNFMYEYSPLSY